MVALATTHIAIVSKCCVSIVDRCTGISFKGIFVEKKRTKFQYSVPCESVNGGIVISFEMLTTRCPIQWEILVHSMNPIFASLGIVKSSFDPSNDGHFWR